jgi:hypothetical protein
MVSWTTLYSNSFDSGFGPNVVLEGDTRILDGAAYFDGTGDLAAAAVEQSAIGLVGLLYQPSMMYRKAESINCSGFA